MRQTLGEKKLKQLRERTGLPIRYASVRGGTNHRINLHLDDAEHSIWYLCKDGELVKADYTWVTEAEFMAR